MKKQIYLFLILILFLSACEQLGFGPGEEEEGLQLPEKIEQWAIKAKASSSFAGRYSQAIDDQSPYAATGEPDVEQCGDYKYEKYAWAPAHEDKGEEWLELEYDDDVFVSDISIKEISEVGAIIKIELMNKTDYVVIWEGTDTVEDCPGFLDINLENMTAFKSDTVRITLDTDQDGWNMIDAVKLSGYEKRWHVVNETLIWE